jgi:hypothetical protein
MRNTVWIGLALSVLLPLATGTTAHSQGATFASADEASRALKASFDLWRSGRFEEAIPLGERVVAYDPGLRYANEREKVRLVASVDLALAYAFKGDVENAERCALLARAYAPRSAAIPVVLAWAVRERQRRGLPPRSVTADEQLTPKAWNTLAGAEGGSCGAGTVLTAQLKVGSGSMCVNGREVSLPRPFGVADGTGLVPIRPLVEALGGMVKWDDSTTSATADLASKCVTFTLGSPVGVAVGSQDHPLRLPVGPFLDQGNMIVPVRSLAEALGGKVEWSDQTETVSVTIPAPSTGSTEALQATANSPNCTSCQSLPPPVLADYAGAEETAK